MPALGPVRGGIVAMELRELVDDLRNCLEASETVGDGYDSTGEGILPCILSVGETARALVGEVVAVISPGADSAGTVVRGASGAGFAELKKAP